MGLGGFSVKTRKNFCKQLLWESHELAIPTVCVHIEIYKLSIAMGSLEHKQSLLRIYQGHVSIEIWLGFYWGSGWNSERVRKNAGQVVLRKLRSFGTGPPASQLEILRDVWNQMQPLGEPIQYQYVVPFFQLQYTSHEFLGLLHVSGNPIPRIDRKLPF